VHFAEDDLDGALHLAAVDGAGRVVGVATWAPVPCLRRPGRVAWRLRGMAVEPALQGAGVGSVLLEAALPLLRRRGAEVLWADGRDTALAFYERHGWVVEGDGYLTATGVPHHTVVRELTTGPGGEPAQ
jgi:GNAT superfamily N-acetyltransferase